MAHGDKQEVKGLYLLREDGSEVPDCGGFKFFIVEDYRTLPVTYSLKIEKVEHEAN